MACRSRFSITWPFLGRPVIAARTLCDCQPVRSVISSRVGAFVLVSVFLVMSDLLMRLGTMPSPLPRASPISRLGLTFAVLMP